MPATVTGAPSSAPGMGAIPGNGAIWTFRVWAPNASAVSVAGDFNGWQPGQLALQPDGSGYWSADVSGVSTGDLYKFVIQNVGGSASNPGGMPLWRVDPYAREVTGTYELANGIAVDPAYNFSEFGTPGFADFILYELHIGSFAGFNDGIPVTGHTAGFQQIISKLGYIRDLGFNAIAFLPVEEAMADVGEGYAPTSWFTPDEEYGPPSDLRALVEAAHQQGLAVIFDVVYNHGAPDDNRTWVFDGMDYDGGIYYQNGGDTQFGHRPAHWEQEVRNYFLDNARMLVREYNADGLRFDAVQLIQPESIQEIVAGLQQDFPNKYFIAEYFANSPDPIRGLGFNAIWDGGAPQAFRDAVGGNTPVDNVKSFLGWWPFNNAWNFVRYLHGSHDQIADIQGGAQTGCRYLIEFYGGRENWYTLAKARLGWGLNVALPGTPMLFMGSECHMWGYWAPDPDDNGDHRFNWAIAGDPTGLGMRSLVTDVNQVRWNNPALRSDSLQIVHEDYTNQVIAFKRWDLAGNIVLTVVNLGDAQWQNGDYGVVMGGESGAWEEIFNSQSPQYGGWAGSGNYGAWPAVQPDGSIYINLPRWSVLMFRKA